LLSLSPGIPKKKRNWVPLPQMIGRRGRAAHPSNHRCRALQPGHPAKPWRNAGHPVQRCGPERAFRQDRGAQGRDPQTGYADH